MTISLSNCIRISSGVYISTLTKILTLETSQSSLDPSSRWMELRSVHAHKNEGTRYQVFPVYWRYTWNRKKYSPYQSRYWVTIAWRLAHSTFFRMSRQTPPSWAKCVAHFCDGKLSENISCMNHVWEGAVDITPVLHRLCSSSSFLDRANRCESKCPFEWVDAVHPRCVANPSFIATVVGTKIATSSHECPWTTLSTSIRIHA